MSITCPTDAVACDGNGEVLVSDILLNLSQLVDACNEAQICCDRFENADIIRTRKVDNVLYMTNDGTAP